MGIAALECHAKGDKHNMKLASSGTVNIEKLCKVTNQSGDKGNLNSSAVMAAEIKWVLKVVTSPIWFHSCLDVNEISHSMFSDCHIAKSFKLCKTKYFYLINFGIAPYF